MIINDNGVRREATASEADCHSPERRLLSAKRGALAQVNDEAARRIAAVWGKPAGSMELLHVQMNAQARATILLDRRGTDAEAPGDAAEVAALRQAAADTLAIRDASNQIAAAIEGATDEGVVMVIQSALGTDSRWP